MGLLSDDLTADVNGHRVMVSGRSGFVKGQWTLTVDGQVVDQGDKFSGQLTLSGMLPSGGEVRAQIQQSAFGPTVVQILDGDRVVSETEGFVA